MTGATLASGPDGRRWRRGLVAVVALAVLLRLPLFVQPTLWYDDAVEGLMSLDVLRGRFPIFFYGQPAHGPADRYLAALVIGLLGPTPAALRLASLGLSLAWVGSVAWVTRRVFGHAVAAVATLLVAVPPYYLYGWTVDARGHYLLTLLLGTWLLYLAWRILGEGVARSPARRFPGLGLLAGLAWWTNYLSLVVLGPVALALGVQGLRAVRAWRALLPRLGLAVGGFLVGAAPILAYHLPHGLLPLPPGSAAAPEAVVASLGSLARDALPQVLGVHPAVWGRAHGLVYAVVLALTAGATGHAAAWGWTRGRAGGGRMVGLLLGLVLTNGLLVVFTGYGAILRFPRHLLPLYLALPVFLALLVARLATRSRVGAALLLLALAVNHALGALALTPVLESAGERARRSGWAPLMAAQLEFLQAHGLTRLYGGSNLWTYLSGRRILVSDPYQERVLETARGVDAAERVGWVFREPSAAFEESARAAGFHFRRLDGPALVAYTDFALPGPAHADLEPEGWSAASPGADDAPLAFDGDLGTAWRRVGRPGAPWSYRLDLGRPVTVGMVSWVPASFREIPAAFTVAVSADGERWQPVARVGRYFGPLYWSGTHPFQRVRRGRVEVRFAPVPARYLQLELAAEPEAAVSMRELVVSTPAGSCPGRYDSAALVALLRRVGVREVYADHWVSARIAEAAGETIRVLPSNRSVTSYRLERPDPDEVEPLRLRPGRALVVEACPAAIPERAAAVLQAYGVRFRHEGVGGFAVFTDLARPRFAGTTVPWWREGGDPRVLVAALDGPRVAGSLVVECAEPWPGRPGAVRLEVSADGRAFAAVPARLVPLGRLRLVGHRLFADRASRWVVEFPAQSARAVRLTREGPGDWCTITRVRIGGEAG